MNKTYISAFVMMKSMKLLTHALTLQSFVVVNHPLLLVLRTSEVWNPESSLSAPGIEPGPPAHKSEHVSERPMTQLTELKLSCATPKTRLKPLNFRCYRLCKL